ncbi:DUF1236 domain-containing protein [Ensifer sp. SSB1]|uniref:DUF1236 domain-containing protein n=1 Tax=Ensifer sp. SSB1 TaxID=2795385 RepID=UPI001A3DC842|nr:DUF1236 domain-containing protein [Ensifer sp. SSB1]MBK5566083.1 DUF1236 domain-containing protein [Ensifer sp. SSB1]
MTNILVKSALALSLGTMGVPAFAQTEQPAQGQAAEQPAQGQSSKCPVGTECPKGGGEQSQQPEMQGKGKAQQGQTTEQQKTDRKKVGAENQTQEQEGAAKQNDASKSQQSGNEQPAKEGEATQSGQSKSKPSGQGQSAKSTTKVTVEQKTEITQVIKEEKVRPIDVDFDVSVGVVVPRTTKVKLQPLPGRIVRIVPAYEGYLFFVLADGRIVIVDPSSLEVVVILA